MDEGIPGIQEISELLAQRWCSGEPSVHVGLEAHFQASEIVFERVPGGVAGVEVAVADIGGSGECQETGVRYAEAAHDVVNRFVMEVSAVALKFGDESRNDCAEKMFGVVPPASPSSGQFVVDVEHSVKLIRPGGYPSRVGL